MLCINEHDDNDDLDVMLLTLINVIRFVCIFYHYLLYI